MRIGVVGMPVALLVAGCHHATSPGNTARPVDINSAAQEAQGDIDSYASTALHTATGSAAEAAAPRPAPTRVAAPAQVPSPAPVAASSLAATDASGGKAAAALVQTYYALIEAGKYRRAWALWGDGGKASGKTPAEFAQGFRPYADYHARIGTPGRVDAGAGQRFVTVPVEVHGHRAPGNRPFALRGSVKLHRTADIAGARAEQRAWRISSIDLRPVDAGGSMPATTPIAAVTGVPASAEADYRCTDGYRFHILFDNRANTGTISVAGKLAAVLRAQVAGSGIWYKGAGYELRGKGDSARLSRPAQPTVTCTAR
ncbi:MAG: MliC family protein [Sphingomonas sp.]